jgi:transaldolase
MYPDSALSAVQLTVMAVVVVVSLAAWLTLVLLAARQPRGASEAANAGPREEETSATVTQLPSGASPADKTAALSGKAAAGVRVYPALRPRERVREWPGKRARAGEATRSPGGVMTDSIARLRTAGVSVWLDDLSRERLTSGSLAALRDRGVSGVTSNPTIFARAITDSDAYDSQIRDLRLRQAPVDQALRELTTSDVRQACDVLHPVHEATGGVDGRVSIEVDPRIAHDTQRTVAEARALWWLVDRPNLFVKIPAAKQGLPAITACLAEGISINVTLIFSLARYGEVIEAFLAGLEQARGAGRDLSGIASVASFFVSRVDTETDRRLDKIGTGQAAALRGKAAIANARLAYQRYEEMIAADRWKSLERAGARPQRPLWASTSVKDPAYDDTRYVTGLVAPGVVNTMPEATLNAVTGHGDIPDDSVHGTYEQSQAVLDDLAALGIDYGDVVQTLEDQGVTAFDASWDHLGQRLATALGTRQE